MLERGDSLVIDSKSLNMDADYKPFREILTMKSAIIIPDKASGIDTELMLDDDLNRIIKSITKSK
jgi:hypothetical protein